MNSYQIIIYILKEIAKWKADYPVDLLESRRDWWKAQIDARKRGESTAGNGALART